MNTPCEVFEQSPIVTFSGSGIFTHFFDQSESEAEKDLPYEKSPQDHEINSQEETEKKIQHVKGCNNGAQGKRKLIFKKKDGRKIWTYVSPQRGQKGNKNFVKFLIKSYFSRYVNQIDCSNQADWEYMKELKKQTYKDGRKRIGIEHLKRIVGSSQHESNKEKSNRRILHKILTSPQLRMMDIIGSSFIKKKVDKKQTLIASKVYGLRLTHRLLVNRVQSR